MTGGDADIICKGNRAQVETIKVGQTIRLAGNTVAGSGDLEREERRYYKTKQDMARQD